MNKYRAKSIVLTLAALMIFSLASCAAENPTTTTTAGTTLVKAAFISQDTSNASQAFSQEQFLKFDEEFGFEVVALDSKGDVKTESELISTCIAQGFKVIFINPNDMQASAPAIKRAKEAGIIVGLFSSDLTLENQQYRDFYCGIDDVDAGNQAAKAFMAQFPDGAKVVEVGGQNNHGAQINRHTGFVEAIAGSKIEVIDFKTTQLWDSSQAMAVMETMIAKYGNEIQGVFCHWDNGSMGVIEALKAANQRQDLFIVSVDGNKNGFRQVADGQQAITLAQNFTNMARKSLELARAVVDGKSIERINWIPLDVVTKDNVASFPQPEW